MAKEEILMKLSMLEQQSDEIKKQLESVDSQITDMEVLKMGIGKIGKSKEMLSNLGRGIFLKTKVDDNKVFVNVGSKILVRKSFPEAEEVIDAQLAELEKIKREFMNSIEQINASLYGLVEEARKEGESAK